MIIRKPTLNFIINALMLFCMSAITGTGFLIKYTLISRQEQMIRYGNKVNLSLLGMDRHEWGTIHFIFAYILIGLLVLHIILHWKIIVSVYKKLSQKKPVIKFITIVFITICFLFILIPFIINKDTMILNNSNNIENSQMHRRHH